MMYSYSYLHCGMAPRKRKFYSTAEVFVLLFCFWQVPSRVCTVTFKDFDISEPWARADNACKKKGMVLAQIDNINLLDLTKARLYKGSYSSKIYWTGLSFYKKKLSWSDGRQVFCNGSLSGVLHCDGLTLNLNSRLCFVVTAINNTLQRSDCNVAQRFICQTVKKVEPTSKSPQVTHTATHGNSHGGGLIENYLKTIRFLNESDPSSLQQAVNATDRLLKDLKTSEENMNVLLATDALETFVKSYAKQQLTTVNDTIIERRDEFVIITRKIPSNPGDVIVSATPGLPNGSLPFNESDVQIRLPARMFHEHGGYMTIILHKNMHQLLPLHAQDSLDGIKTQSGHIGSNVISITVEPGANPLRDRVYIDFRHLKFISPISKPDCVFWNFSLKSAFNGSWSKKGCRVFSYTSSKTVCSCDHLTHFAVLMQVKDTDKISIQHQVALEIITYVGCALSLMGEATTIVAYVVFLNLRVQDTQIRLNFVASIAVAQLIFILGIGATQSKVICATVAATLHYFFLVSFCWMMIEGLTLYYKVVKVFDTDFKMWPFYAFTWGFPMIVVLISLLTAATSGSGIMSYISDNFCWLSFSNGLVWFFVAPVLVITLLNTLVLARVARELFTMHPTNSSESNKFKQVLRACVVLFPLLGVTWVFGVFSVTEPIGLASQYLFTIFNSLQGFFIFLLHVVRSSDFRATVKRKFQRWGSKRNTHIVPALALPTNNNNDEVRKHSTLSGHEERTTLKTTSRRHTPISFL